MPAQFVKTAAKRIGTTLRTGRFLVAAALALIFTVVVPMQPGAVPTVSALEETLILPNGPENSRWCLSMATILTVVLEVVLPVLIGRTYAI